MIKLHISCQPDANSPQVKFTSTYPNKTDITPAIFAPGHENELASEAPFIAERIWNDIDERLHQSVLQSSVSCVMEFADGTKETLTSEIINAKHNTSVIKS